MIHIDSPCNEIKTAILVDKEKEDLISVITDCFYDLSREATNGNFTTESNITIKGQKLLELLAERILKEGYKKI